ncbi:HAD-IIB family hydrolase [Rhizobium halophytocola]|uniref:Mannosylfructose-6-phosphate phosphatase n=1 Tax=Rhizobium halophytocola TaxID=735519 RepID=A0ABS4DXS7_9HYPH|nr:HAD-IIB family hydrolase [Rhizobium halophytocola]MBP1850496.1 mannosylfructose-6-phosphate phosphatase [Rhizobium halophytocola]
MSARLFSSDIDGTLAGDRHASQRFAEFWDSLDPVQRPLLVYNSGRLVDDILDFTAGEGLPPADFVIGGVGTMLISDRQPHLADAYTQTLTDGYDVERINALLAGMPGLARQPDRYQHALKSSWYLHDATEEDVSAVEQRLKAEALAVKVVYSSGRDLDVLPANADKGQALIWLADKLGIGLGDVIVAGDTGNDAGMFQVPDVRGIIPANGLEELRRRFPQGSRFFHASQDTADGITEGLLHFRTAL